MKPGAGKKKGSHFERVFARQLSEWWTDGADKNIFWRTSGSGSRHGIAEQSGDICSIKQEGYSLTNAIYFELKCWNANDLLLDMIRADKKSKLREAWFKCINEAYDNHKYPFMVVKVSNKTTICLFRANEIVQNKGDINEYAMHTPSSGSFIMELSRFWNVPSLFTTLKEQKNETKVL